MALQARVLLGRLAALPGLSPAPSDGALVAACLAGNQRAWNELVARYHTSVWNIAVHQFRLSEQDAEDMTQKTFKQVVMKLSQKDQTHTLGAWIHGIARRVILDFLRSQNRHIPHEALSDELVASNGNLQDAMYRAAYDNVAKRLSGNKRKIWDAICELGTLDDKALSQLTGIALGTCHTEKLRLLPIAREELDRAGLKPKAQ